MIVDDEPDAIQLFRRMLISSNQDYRILTALDGKQALELMQVEKPDLILLDLIMPEMDGLQLLASLSTDPNISKIPVIIISARDPIDQPLCSHSLLVTRGGGLPVSQILTCIKVLSDILGTTGSPTRQAFSKVPSG
jgi:CheY-like chemotaxis protein